MEKMVGLFPVLPGKDARAVAAVLRGHREEYLESRRRGGIRMERAYEQVTPMGTFVAAYIETERGFAASTAALAESDLAIDRDFVAAVREVHGYDPTQPPLGELPELLGDWADKRAPERKAGLAFCAPIRPGAADPARTFGKEAFEQRVDEHTASRRALGVSREVVMLNHTPAGDVICVYLEGDDPVESNRVFAASRSDYDVWFKDQCATIFAPGIDFNQPVPPVRQIFDSEDVVAGR